MKTEWKKRIIIGVVLCRSSRIFQLRGLSYVTNQGPVGDLSIFMFLVAMLRSENANVLTTGTSTLELKSCKLFMMAKGVQLALGNVELIKVV